MPEIVIPGLRDVGNGPSEASHKKLDELRRSDKVKLWAESGTFEEVAESWKKFLLADTPEGWVIYSNE